MKGYFSRLSFDARRRYAAPLQQQGRVGSDADFNEWVEILLHRLKMQTIDTIGNCGRPKASPGFLITPKGSSVIISAGRLYSGGMLVELADDTDFKSQVDWPFPDQNAWNELTTDSWPGLDFSGLGSGGVRKDLFYAETWLRHVTALNDEAERAQALQSGSTDWDEPPLVGDYIRERAFGGPDTCTRLQTVSQVKYWTILEDIEANCDDACTALTTSRPLTTDGKLLVTVPPTTVPTDPCTEPLSGGYGGAENRAYRVEIHDPGAPGTATFKWSNENGAFTVRVQSDKNQTLTKIPAGTNIVVLSIGPDQKTQLQQNDWVELCGEDTELNLWRNRLTQIKAAPTRRPDGTFALQLTADVSMARAPFLRRWSDQANTVPTLGKPFALVDPQGPPSGIQITFSDKDGATAGAPFFHEMDYWAWAARTKSRDIEPVDITQKPQAVRGIDRAYCCLAIVTWTGAGEGADPASTVDECPHDYPPSPGESGCCCTITVGDGKTSTGQYTDIAEAIDNLPYGGILCIQQGTYTVDAPITIPNDNIIIQGCGIGHTIINGVNGIFTLERRKSVTIKDLTLNTTTAPAVAATSVNDLTIIDSAISVGRSGDSSAYAISVLGTDIEISRNRIVGDNNGGAGILIRGSSNGIRIRDNFLADGTNRGITLGSIVLRRDQPIDNIGGMVHQVGPSEGPVDNVEISGNVILRMGLEAIGTIFSLDDQSFTSSPVVGQTVIKNNEIRNCLRLQEQQIGGVVFDQATGAIAIYTPWQLEIVDNIIENNGTGDALGILIHLSRGLRIHRNRIVGNGGAAANRPPDVRGGVRVQSALAQIGRAQDLIAGDIWPALSLCGNTIEGVLGPALWVAGMGRMVINDNDLVSTGFLPNAANGLVVHVANASVGPHIDRFINFATNSTANPIAGTSGNIVAFQTAGGETMFANNRIRLGNVPLKDFPPLAGRSLPSIDALMLRQSAVYITTLDDLRFSGNQVDVDISQSLAINALLTAMTLRVEDNRFRDRALIAACVGYGLFVTGIGNQADTCLIFHATWPGAEAVSLNVIPPSIADRCNRRAVNLFSKIVFR